MTDWQSDSLEGARSILDQGVLEGILPPGILDLPERDRFRYVLVLLKQGLAQAIERGDGAAMLSEGLAGIRTLEAAILELR